MALPRLRIACASDHAGYQLKKEIIEHLLHQGVDVVDFGCGPGEVVDYVDYGAKAIESMLKGECDRAILFCGTGMGMAIVANKFPSILATACWDEFTAQVSRSHNNSNCLCLGGRVLDLPRAKKIVEIWLSTPFDGGRHERRINKIFSLEKKKFFQEEKDYGHFRREG